MRWWLEAGWEVTQAPQAQAPKFGMMLISEHNPFQKAPRGGRVWEIKLSFGSRRRGKCMCVCVCMCVTTTHSPSARQDGRRHGGGKTQLPLCTGFSVWKTEITPPIRKGLEGFMHCECEGLPGTRSQKQAPLPSACSQCCHLSLFSTVQEKVWATTTGVWFPRQLQMPVVLCFPSQQSHRLTCSSLSGA